MTGCCTSSDDSKKYQDTSNWHGSVATTKSGATLSIGIYVPDDDGDDEYKELSSTAIDHHDRARRLQDVAAGKTSTVAQRDVELGRLTSFLQKPALTPADLEYVQITINETLAKIQAEEAEEAARKQEDGPSCATSCSQASSCVHHPDLDW